jgi:hypothetical protein
LGVLLAITWVGTLEGNHGLQLFRNGKVETEIHERQRVQRIAEETGENPETDGPTSGNLYQGDPQL